MNILQKNSNITSTVFTFIALLSLYYYLFFDGDINIWLKNTIGSDVTWLIVGYGLWCLIKGGLSVDIKYFRLPILFLAVFFSLTVLIGHAFTINGSLDMYLTKLGIVLFFFSIFGFIIIFGSILLLVYNFIDKTDIRTAENHWLYNNDKRTFFMIWGVVFCCYLIYLIQLYPGVTTYDSIIEINQYTIGEYSNHHPFIHVMLIHLMLKVSEFFGGSLETGIFLYSVLQMLIMSGIFAYALSFIIKKRVNKFIVLFLFFFYAILPVHAVYSITMWKDILFSGICLFIVIQLVKLVYYPQVIKNKPYFFLLGFLLLLFSILRNNGFYAFVLFIPILVLINKAYRKQLFIMALSVFGCVMIYSSILLPSLDVKKGSLREAVSIPLQQIARTVKYHGDEISMAEKSTIRNLFETDSIGLLYQSHISDFVKGRFNEDKFRSDPKRYINLWVSLFKKYPKTYIESFIAGSYGYIDPSVNYGGAYLFNTIQDYEYSGYHFFSPNLKDNSAPVKANLFLRIPKFILIHSPILSLFTSIGMMIWIALILIMRCIMDRCYKHLLPFCFLACLYLTVLASPIYAEYRYVYGIIISIPILCCVVLLDKNKLIKQKTKVKVK